MLSFYLGVWKSRGSSAAVTPATWTWNRVVWSYLWYWCTPKVKQPCFWLPGHYLCPCIASGTWEVLEWRDFWVLSEKSSLCSHLPMWSLGEPRARSSLGFLGIEESKEQFMCRSTLRLIWFRRGVLYARILECPNHQRATFVKMKHRRARFPTASLLLASYNN